VPYDEKAAADLRASGEQPSPLHNNFRQARRDAASPRRRWMPSAGYWGRSSMQQSCERRWPICGRRAQEIPIAVDGCGVPGFLRRCTLAYAYARLMATSGAAGALD
jgi:L-asparaginase II